MPAKRRPRESARPQRPAARHSADAVGSLLRKGASLDWDVRWLDPKIRSATEVEEGRTEIVINNQFPLYKQRGGDLLYMLETGLREELKSGGTEEVTAIELEDHANEAIYLATASLTNRC